MITTTIHNSKSTINNYDYRCSLGVKRKSKS